MIAGVGNPHQISIVDFLATSFTDFVVLFALDGHVYWRLNCNKGLLEYGFKIEGHYFVGRIIINLITCPDSNLYQHNRGQGLLISPAGYCWLLHP